MTQGMPEIRFPLRSRAARRARSQAAPPRAPLDEIAHQIRELDQAAKQVADKVAAAAHQLRTEGSSARSELTASVADALVDRTGEIRNDCEKLASLVTRSAKLIAEREGAPTGSMPPPERPLGPAPAAAESEDEQETEATTSLPPLAVAPTGEFSPDELAAHETSASPVHNPDSASGGTSEGVRLIATQMAIAGSSRAEIEHRLRIQFGVVDAGQALDDIFGNRRSGVQ
jgi:signal transduction histidine kinase